MYAVNPIDLSAAFEKREISAPQRRITEIIVFDVPGGASFQLMVGNNSEWMTIPRGFTMEPTGDKEANTGLYVRNLEDQAGVELEIIVVYGGAELNTVLT
jgi:hypothetical protein